MSEPRFTKGCNTRAYCGAFIIDGKVSPERLVKPSEDEGYEVFPEECTIERVFHMVGDDGSIELDLEEFDEDMVDSFKFELSQEYYNSNDELSPEAEEEYD